MTPKEKAKELVDKFYPSVQWKLGQENCLDRAKQCALIAVDEIIESSPSLPILGDGGTFGEDIELSKIYWQEVKHELENI
jgi:hypothetical protein